LQATATRKGKERVVHMWFVFMEWVHVVGGTFVRGCTGSTGQHCRSYCCMSLESIGLSKPRPETDT
jgi:hypothetical protein